MTAAPSTAAVLKLPCAGICTTLTDGRVFHSRDCPAHYQEAVAAALSAKDAKSAELRTQIAEMRRVALACSKMSADERYTKAQGTGIDIGDVARMPSIVELSATILTLRSALEPVAEAFKRLGPTGYFPAMGAPLSDKIRNAVAEFFPEVGKVVGSSFDRKAQ